MIGDGGTEPRQSGPVNMRCGPGTGNYQKEEGDVDGPLTVTRYPGPMLHLEEWPYWIELPHADRVRLVAQELQLAGGPRTMSEALQEAADALEEGEQ